MLSHPKLLFNELVQVLPEKSNKPFYFSLPSFVFHSSALCVMYFQRVLGYFCLWASVHSSFPFVWCIDHGDCSGESGNIGGFISDEQMKVLRVSQSAPHVQLLLEHIEIMKNILKNYLWGQVLSLQLVNWCLVSYPHLTAIVTSLGYKHGKISPDLRPAYRTPALHWC